jgi:hypothetical protein
LKDLSNARLLYDIFNQIHNKNEEAREYLKRFIDILKTKKLVIIGGKHLRNIPIPYIHFIETPTYGATCWIEYIVNEILKYGKPATYLFSCGIAANVVIGEVYGKIKNSSFIDIGSFWDFALGIGIRAVPEWEKDVPFI